MEMVKSIREIVKQECRQRGIRVADLARSVGLDPFYLYNILGFTKVSRRVIFRVAEFLNKPELLYVYEEQLRKIKTKEVKRQKKKGLTPLRKNSQGGRKDAATKRS